MLRVLALGSGVLDRAARSLLSGSEIVRVGCWWVGATVLMLAAFAVRTDIVFPSVRLERAARSSRQARPSYCRGRLVGHDIESFKISAE